MEYSHPVCSPFHSVISLVVVVLKFLPTLQTSILTLVSNSPGCSVAMFLNRRFQYYFIGDL